MEALPPANLQQAFTSAESEIRLHSKTFHFATAFLPERQRRAIRALYAFCRATDDLVDRRGASAEQIEEWRRRTDLPANQQSNPALAAWTATREAYSVDRRYEQELIDGVKMDIAKDNFSTWTELEQYCYRVGSTVGLLSLPIIGLRPGASFAQAAPFAIRLGIALQLTNILRDVGEDAGHGRVYLPTEDLAAHGLSAFDILHRTMDSRVEALIRFEIGRARDYYRFGLPGIALLRREARAAVGLAALLYRAILDEIERKRCNVFAGRAHTSLGRKLQLLPGSLWTVLRLAPPAFAS